MLTGKSSTHAARRSRPARHGAITMEYVFAGALALVILGALILTVYFGFIHTPGGLEEALQSEFTFRCVKCEHEFTKERDDLPVYVLRIMGEGLMFIDCPKCNAKDSAYQLVECPKCKKLYLAPAYSDPEAYLQGLPGANVCEHCGLDVGKWFREHGGEED